jgi:hypothetical protein
MNSNLFHNIANVLIVLLSGLTAALLATGCVTLANGNLDCSASWISPVWTTAIVTGLSILKVIVNLTRDGFSGLFKQQPPVKA